MIGITLTSFWARYFQCWNEYESQKELDVSAVAAVQHSTNAECILSADCASSLCLRDYGTQAVALFHSEKGCVEVSENWPELTGHTRAACTGGLFFFHLHPDQRERVLQLIASAPESGEENVKIKCRLQHAGEDGVEGNWQWYQLALFPAPPEDHTQHDTIMLLHNIHEEVQMQHRMQKTKIDAELKEHMRSKFIGDVSHDLRTPLNAIIGFTQMMESGIFGPIGNLQYHDYLRHIRESGYELLDRIDDLLDSAGEPMYETLTPAATPHFRLRETAA